MNYKFVNINKCPNCNNKDYILWDNYANNEIKALECKKCDLIYMDKILSNKDLIKFYQSLDRSATYDGKDFFNMYMTSFLQLLIDNGWKIRGVPVENGWLEVDSVEDLSLYESMGKKGTLGNFYEVDN